MPYLLPWYIPFLPVSIAGKARLAAEPQGLLSLSPDDDRASSPVHLFRSEGDIWAEKMMWEQEGGLLAASGVTPAEGQKGDNWTSLSLDHGRGGV